VGNAHQNPYRGVTMKLIKTILVILVFSLSLILTVNQDVLAMETKANYTLSDVYDQNFDDENLYRSSFAGASVRDSSFRQANLAKSILTKAGFFQVDFTGANLEETLGDRVMFEKCNLTDAILTDAILTSTTFVESVITGADFSNALLDRYQAALLCKKATGVNSVTGVATKDSLGCR
jgi:uncharacterized protein YjbI with pentapeptide repeats